MSFTRAVGAVVIFGAAVLYGPSFLKGLAQGISDSSEDQSRSSYAADDRGIREAPISEPAMYEVTGEGPVSITYTTDRRLSMAQESNVLLPWKWGVPDDRGVLGLSLVVRRKSGDNGWVTCTIKRGNKIIKTVTSAGPYVLATCRE